MSDSTSHRLTGPFRKGPDPRRQRRPGRVNMTRKVEDVLDPPLAPEVAEVTSREVSGSNSKLVRDPRVRTRGELPALQPASSIPAPEYPNTPAGALSRAKDRMRRMSPVAARKLEELMEEMVADDGMKCPTCGRGTRRDEELRLKAILGLLDRAGATAPAAAREVAGATEGGPVLVFPPGTRMAVAIGQTMPLESIPATETPTARRVGRPPAPRAEADAGPDLDPVTVDGLPAEAME